MWYSLVRVSPRVQENVTVREGLASVLKLRLCYLELPGPMQVTEGFWLLPLHS